MTFTVAELEASLERMSREDPATAARVDALAALAWELRAQDPRRAILLGREAATLARELSHPRGLARSLLASAAGHVRLSELSEAANCAREAFSLCEEASDQDGAASSLNMLGNVQVARGEYAEALGAYEHSLRLREVASDRRAEAATLSNIGTIYEKLGDYSKSLEYCHRSLAVSEEIGDQDRTATALANIGVVHQLLGDWVSAMEAFERGAEVFERLGDRKHQAKCLNNLGVVCRDRQDYPRALQHYEKAHEAATAMQDPETIALTLGNMGDTYRLLGAYEEAERLLLQSLDVGQRAGNATVEMNAEMSIGITRCDAHDPHGALVHLHAALAIAHRTGYRQWVRNAHEALATAYEATGDLSRALEHWKAFHHEKTALLEAQAEEAAQALRLRLELGKVRHDGEMHRLRHVELARANQELEAASERLRRSDQEKSALVEQLREKSALLEQETREDALTGLSNRRHLEQMLDHEFRRARRFGHPLALIMIDVDRFKDINDRHSHVAGDAVLRHVGAVIRSACRTVDAAARYGGDEFVVVLPETRVGDALLIGERIRLEVESLASAEFSAALRPTVSVGVADDVGSTSPSELLGAVDRALYAAKERGRNRVVAHS